MARVCATLSAGSFPRGGRQQEEPQQKGEPPREGTQRGGDGFKEVEAADDAATLRREAALQCSSPPKHASILWLQPNTFLQHPCGPYAVDT